MDVVAQDDVGLAVDQGVGQGRFQFLVEVDHLAGLRGGQGLMPWR